MECVVLPVSSLQHKRKVRCSASMSTSTLRLTLTQCPRGRLLARFGFVSRSLQCSDACSRMLLAIRDCQHVVYVDIRPT